MLFVYLEQVRKVNGAVLLFAAGITQRKSAVRARLMAIITKRSIVSEWHNMVSCIFGTARAGEQFTFPETA